MRFKAIIFDWDGTLVNSTARIVDSMQRAGREAGLPSVCDASVQNIIGLGLPEAIRTVWPEVTEEQLLDVTPRYARYFVSDSQVDMDFFQGVPTFLTNLKAQGRQLAVATGKTRRGLDRMIQDMNLQQVFSATRCADETRSKPHPLMLHELLDELKLHSHEALMVGDTTYDLDMARSINMPAIGMTYGAHAAERLWACEPLTLCHSIYELNEWIHQHG